MSGKKRSRKAADPTPAASLPVSGSRAVGKSRKREQVKLASDADVVLAKCRALKKTLLRKTDSDSLTIADVVGSIAGLNNSDDDNTIPKDIVEVDELSATEVLEGIEGVALQITRQVLAKKGFSMEIPSRSASNQIYVKEWDRIVLGGKRLGRNFMNVRESRKSAIMLRVMQLLHAVLVKRIHITKRDLFYTDVKLFVDQAESDGVLDDVATMIGCTRSNLHVVASDKGLVVGRIQFEEDGDFIDCTKMGVGGKAIPPYIDKIENIRSDAEFILLVEKEAAYMRMAVRLFCTTWILQSFWNVLYIRSISSVPKFSFHMFHSHKARISFRLTAAYDLSTNAMFIILTGRSFLSQIPLYRYYGKRTTGRCVSNVPFSHYQRTQDTSPWVGGFRSLRSENLVRLHVRKQEHELRQCFPYNTQYNVAGIATLGSGQIQPTRTMQIGHDRERYQDWERIACRRFHSKESKMDERIRNHGEDKEEGRNSGLVFVRFSIYYRRVPA